MHARLPARLLTLVLLFLGLALPGCDELDDETYIAVMVERLRLVSEEGLTSSEALIEAARCYGTTAEEVRGYSRWLFRDRDRDVEVAVEIARRGLKYLRVP
ncbi:hypothetical protein KAU45_04395 [bacterium]|nr:hypothetical protein [bacterium]